MKQDIKVPAMGESITEATIGSILKPTGSQVAMDDEILELETDKVNQVLYAQSAGVVTWTVQPDETVKIGQVIGSIDSAAKAAATQAPKTQPETPPPQKAAPQEAPKKTPKEASKAPSTASAARVRVSREEYASNFQTSQEKPVEPLPKALESHVESHIEKVKMAPGARTETRQKISKIRKVIATRLLEVQHTTAMLTTFNEIDLSEVASLREKHKDAFTKQHGTKLGYMSFFVKATVAALMEYPGVNSYMDGDEIVHREYYDIGIAIGTERGLIVPVVKNCDHLSFAGVESAIETFAKKAREGTLSMDDLQGGGFTITNGGTYGSLLSTPILNPSQCGILGMHKIVKRPVVVNDQIVIRPMMYVALSYDHRLIDGKEAVSFLVHIKNSLEDPARLLLDL